MFVFVGVSGGVFVGVCVLVGVGVFVGIPPTVVTTEAASLINEFVWLTATTVV